MRVAIAGTGGVGGYFGGQLAAGGEEVTFIARGEHLHAATRLRVESEHAPAHILPINATDAIEGHRSRSSALRDLTYDDAARVGDRFRASRRRLMLTCDGSGAIGFD